MRETNPPPPDLTWSVRPVAGDPVRGAAALVLIAGVSAGASVWGGPVLGGLSLVLLGGGAGPFFVRSRYRLSRDGVEVRSPFQRIRRPWKDFRRAYVGARGVSLSPFRRRHFLEPYRSVMLRYGDRRDEVLDWVSRFGPGDAS